ncbi:hypothetical protein AB0F81_41700 [Actinoplanes sp. NPDC024001]
MLDLLASDLLAAQKTPVPPFVMVLTLIGAIAAMLVAYLLWRRSR